MNRFAIVVVLICALAAGLWLGAAYFEPAQHNAPIQLLSGTAISNPRPLQPFTLQDESGSPFTDQSLLGRWSLIGFGYTHCPDVCPTTMNTLATVEQHLQKMGHDQSVGYLFVSVDPQRDTLETLIQYSNYFSPSIVGVTGEDAQLQILTRQLGILYARVEESNSALEYLVDHSAAIIATNPEGRLGAVFSAPHNPDALAQDLATLIGR